MTAEPPADHSLHLALQGVRVLDLTQNLPGPYATLVLASLGAEVIKVEPPKGETARGVPAFFDLVNRGKKSVALDLKSELGRAQLLRLTADADVLIEGFRPGVLESLDLAPARLHAHNPRLIVCRVSGFGQEGPYAQHPSHDLNLQALTGVCHLSRDAEGRPLGSALPIADLSAGLTATTAVLAALRKREATGAGLVLDVALSDTVQSWAYIWDKGLMPANPAAEPTLRKATSRLSASKLALGRGLGRAMGDAQRSARLAAALDKAGVMARESAPLRKLERLKLHALPHYGIYKTRDARWLAVGIVDEGKFWRALCEALELPRLAGMPVPARVLLGRVIRRQIARAFETRTLAEWMERLPRHELPVTPVLDVQQALKDAQLRTRLGVGLDVPLVPYSLAASSGPAPRLDQDGDTLREPA